MSNKRMSSLLPDVYCRGRAGRTCFGRGRPLLYLTSMVEDEQDKHEQEEDVLSCT
jgi:hypothetical protein